MKNNFEDFKKKLLEDPEVLKEYEALSVEYQIASVLIYARTRAHLSQKEVAERMHTSQPAIARLESGHQLPSMASLKKFAKATGQPLKIEIRP